MEFNEKKGKGVSMKNKNKLIRISFDKDESLDNILEFMINKFKNDLNEVIFLIF